MDIYDRKSKWKWYLAIVGLLIVGITMLSTNYLVEKLSKGEEKKVKLYANALIEEKEKEKEAEKSPEAMEAYLEENANGYLNLVQLLDDVPVILVDEAGNVNSGINFSPTKDTSLSYLEKELASMIASGIKPVEGPAGYANNIYFKNTQLLTLLQYFPIFQFLLISAFIAFGYFTFSSARRAEQNQVWVGMSKETAHQLGTPISAIMGWVDHLRDMYKDDEYLQEVVGELDKDVKRLDLVADRFSKIGSTPKLQAANIYEEIEKIRDYMSRRAARKINFVFPDPTAPPKEVRINAHLFNWVLENLLRNALDAMDGKGTISAKVYEDKSHVCIDVSDTGKGIPPSKFKTVFKPGFSTKKRGWGLGLSLAKRIIETYHSGKIFVAESIPSERTTFTIKLPKKIISSANNSPV